MFNAVPKFSIINLLHFWKLSGKHGAITTSVAHLCDSFMVHLKPFSQLSILLAQATLWFCYFKPMLWTGKSPFLWSSSSKRQLSPKWFWQNKMVSGSCYEIRLGGLKVWGEIVPSAMLKLPSYDLWDLHEEISMPNSFGCCFSVGRVLFKITKKHVRPVQLGQLQNGDIYRITSHACSHFGVTAIYSRCCWCPRRDSRNKKKNHICWLSFEEASIYHAVSSNFTLFLSSLFIHFAGYQPSARKEQKSNSSSGD